MRLRSVDGVDGHVSQSAVSGLTVVPSEATTASNVTLCPGPMTGLDTNAVSGPMPRIAGSPTRQVVDPAFDPSLVTLIEIRRPPGSATTFEMPPLNGPTPETVRRATTASRTTASAIPTNTVPCACDAAGCLRPSGLQRSHIASETGIWAPHRTQPWSGSGATGRAEGVGVMTTCGSDAGRRRIGRDGLMVPRKPPRGRYKAPRPPFRRPTRSRAYHGCHERRPDDRPDRSLLARRLAAADRRPVRGGPRRRRDRSSGRLGALAGGAGGALPRPSPVAGA